MEGWGVEEWGKAWEMGLMDDMAEWIPGESS